MIVGRSKYWQESFVERCVGKPEHGRREPVEEVLHQLNGDTRGRVHAVVDERDVELGDVGCSRLPAEEVLVADVIRLRVFGHLVVVVVLRKLVVVEVKRFVMSVVLVVVVVVDFDVVVVVVE